MKGRCLLQPAGVSDSKQLPTASRDNGSKQSKPPRQKKEQKCPMSNFPRLPASLVAVLGLPCFWWSSTLCPASVFKRQKWLELIFSFVFPLRSKKQICSSAFISGIQLNNCVPFRWINLPAPSIALQFPLCLSYVVFLIMPQELCSHLSLVWAPSLDCRTQDNQSKELSWCWRPFSWCSQHAPRPPSPELISTVCSFLPHFQKVMPNEPSKFTGKFWICYAATKFFLVTTLHRENNCFWKAFSYPMKY